MSTIDIIIPCYNEEEGILNFHIEVCKILNQIKNYSFRFIYIDDGSKDHTLLSLIKLNSENENVDYISFSRNFGKEAAMYAGLTNSTGDYVIIMDADLQHPPSMIPDMLLGINEGYDCCAARRVSRKGESPVRSFFSQSFYHLNNHISKTKMAYGAVDFRIMNRQMVNSILELSEVERFSKGIFSWVGYTTKWLPYENVKRQLGISKWSFLSLLEYAIDGITAFSVAPLKLVSIIGMLISLISFIYIVITIFQTLIFGIIVPGYVTTLCAVLFMGGIIELSIGILGEYISKIYLETKGRPIFITKKSSINDKLNTDSDKNIH
jgi:Glycosyltransferases involved in cell wall biogenesis